MNAPMHQAGTVGANPASPTPCRQCREPFAPKRSWQKFCGAPCRRLFHAGGGVAKVEELERRVVDLERQVADIRAFLVL